MARGFSQAVPAVELCAGRQKSWGVCLNLLLSCPTLPFRWLFGSQSQMGWWSLGATCGGLGGCSWDEGLNPHTVCVRGVEDSKVVPSPGYVCSFPFQPFREVHWRKERVQVARVHNGSSNSVKPESLFQPVI